MNLIQSSGHLLWTTFSAVYSSSPRIDGRLTCFLRRFHCYSIRSRRLSSRRLLLHMQCQIQSRCS